MNFFLLLDNLRTVHNRNGSFFISVFENLEWYYIIRLWCARPYDVIRIRSGSVANLSESVTLAYCQWVHSKVLFIIINGFSALLASNRINLPSHSFVSIFRLSHIHLFVSFLNIYLKNYLHISRSPLSCNFSRSRDNANHVLPPNPRVRLL